MVRFISLAIFLFVSTVWAQEDVTITVAIVTVGEEFEITQTLAERYMEANPGVTINLVQTPDQADDRLALYLQYFETQSSEVDIVQTDVIWTGIVAPHVVDLNPYGADEVIDQHFEAFIENNLVDGALTAMPLQIGAGLLYYRTDLLEEYGYDGPPETWAELEEMARTIQEGERQDNPDFSGFVWQGDAYEGLTCDALEWVHSNGGGRIISTDGVITIDNSNAADILSRVAGWVGTISPTGVTGFAEEDARNFFQAGNAAFMRNWPYAYSLGNAEDSAIAGNFEVASLPAGGVEGGEPTATLGGAQLAVSKYSQNVEVAADVALYLTSIESQKYRAVEGSLSPTIASLYEDEEVLEVNPFFGRLADVFTNAVPRPSTVTGSQYNQVSREFYTTVHSVLMGNENAEDALAILALDLEELTGLPTQ